MFDFQLRRRHVDGAPVEQIGNLALLGGEQLAAGILQRAHRDHRQPRVDLNARHRIARRGADERLLELRVRDRFGGANEPGTELATGRAHLEVHGDRRPATDATGNLYLGTGDNVTYRDMVRDPSILIHEGVHAIIDDYVGLPSEGEGGSFNEGFADLFTALILDNPRMGEASYLKGPFRRTLENQLQAYRDFNSGVYQNGSIVGATFWDMRANLGTELTAKLAFRTVVRLGKGAKFDDFPTALAAASQGFLSPAQQSIVLETARKRGWKVP
mgnify:CR=1 FL=1